MSSKHQSSPAQAGALLITFVAIGIVGVYALVTNDPEATRVARALIFVGAAILGVMEIQRGVDGSTYELVGGGMLFVGSGYGVILELLGTSGFSNAVVAALVFMGIALTWLGPAVDDDGSKDD